MFSGKKFLSVMTAGLIAIPVFCTACKNDTAAKKSSEPVTITYWSAGTAQDGTSRINDAINAYLTQKKADIRVNFQLMGWGDDYKKKVNDMLVAGGSDADIVFTCNWLNPYRANANSGYYEDLTSYLGSSQGKDIVKILGQDFLDGSKIQGKNYALPINKEKAHDWGFLVRSDLFDKYGMDASKIKTLADMEPYLEKAKSEPGVTPLCIAAFDGPWHFLDWDMVMDDDVPLALYNDDHGNKIVDPMTDPTSVALFKQMRDYYNKGYISKDATTAQGIDDELKKGKYFCGVDSLKPGKDKEMSSNALKFTQIDITPAVKSNRETTGSMLAINKFSKHKDQAFELLHMLYTDKTIVNLLVYGQEGTDYTKDSNGAITLNAKSNYVFLNGWMVGNQFNDLLQTTESPSKWDDFTKYNSSAKALPSLGFMYDSTNTATQVSATKQVVDTYYKQLCAGSVDVDSTVAKMSSELKSAGIDTLMADAQKQYDAFIAAKK